jgi:hypothetical protein
VSGFDNQNNAGPASLSLSQIHRFVGNRAVAAGGPFLGGRVLLVEPLNGGMEWNASRVFCDTSDALHGLGKFQRLEGKRETAKDDE